MSKVKIGSPYFSETKVFHLEGTDNRFLTFEVDGQTCSLGEVWKATRTWSPQAAGFGGRIVRFHKQVPCWKTTAGKRTFDTRREAIVYLYRDWLEQS